MKRLVFFPSESIESYIGKGRTYDFLDKYYNPGGYFDEVYCLSPWGDKTEEIIGKTITVQFFEETVDKKTGLYSLRFPILKCVYEGERSY